MHFLSLKQFNVRFPKHLSKSTIFFQNNQVVNIMNKSPRLVFIIVTIQVTMPFLPVLTERLGTYRTGFRSYTKDTQVNLIML